ncbi:MAG TPA: M55 family metallopeptidase [bacterium]|nr:M55 family metallopeptidase [bacterium]
MRIHIMTDLEGVAGVVDFETQTENSGRYYEKAKELLTAEVNAAVEGAMRAGATEVLVCDGHGAGGIIPELIHPSAKLFHGGPLGKFWGIDNGKWDAFFLLAHHSMNGTPDGNLNHTYSSKVVVRMLLNGKPIGEIGMNIYLAGWFGVPTVLITGDEAACREAKQYVPDIETVAVKKGINRTAAITLSPVKAREKIKEGAYRAVQRTGEIKPVKLEGECELIIEYLSSANAFDHAKRPYVELMDGTSVRIKGKNFIEMWERWR